MATKSSNTKILSEQKKNRDFGMKLLTEFHNFSKRYPGYKLTFAQLLSILEKRPNQKHFVEILGGSVLVSGVSQGESLLSMQNLAFHSQGKIPSENVNFRQAIIDKATEFHLVDAVVYTAVESTKQIMEGVQSVGNTLIDTGKILQFLFPVAVVWFLYIFLKKKIA